VSPAPSGVLPRLPRTAIHPLPKIEGYDLIEVIARGGMGTVYRGLHTPTGRRVAVKVLAPELTASQVACKRFEQEFRAACRLDHPNIVRGLDAGEAEAGRFFVMELVDGDSLGDLLARQGPLPPAEAVRLIAQVAEALEYAHEEGLVHRDLKPDNILLGPEGKALLTDFGLVKHLAADYDLTVPGHGLGTPNYIAPEQLLNAKAADRRCDVYGLGATLYAAVTGCCPFAARTQIEVVKKKTRNELTRPRQLVPALSARLEQVILRAMHPDRGQRYATCAEFRQRLLEGGVPEASPASPDVTGAGGQATPSGLVRRPDFLAPPAQSTLVDRHTPSPEPGPAEPVEAPSRWGWLLVAVCAVALFIGAAAIPWVVRGLQ
jgi:serine/threonine-protein kinase